MDQSFLIEEIKALRKAVEELKSQTWQDLSMIKDELGMVTCLFKPTPKEKKLTKKQLYDIEVQKQIGLIMAKSLRTQNRLTKNKDI